MAPKAPGRAAAKSKSPAPKAKAADPKAKAKAAPGPSAEELAAQKKKEEEEAAAKAKAEEEAAAAAKAAEEEAARQKAEAEAEIKRLQALANGEVTVKYNMYAEKFPIKEHKLKAADIDELYCLSDVMPGCFIHLGEKEFAHDEEHVYIKEDPVGTFLGLMAGETYWCYVQQDAEQEERDREKMRKVFAGGVAAGIGDRGSEGEHCSCGDGAPCTDSSICKDWNNRFANALKAGGNPILFT
eukprot:TRINITY_DN3593_c0_g1_i1.p1 TRINITY_DN3593_c0_g1~~TRINITY_DN3593_c0_g1_i1.p1  ORF type:complete len:241 (-),score=91.61 TRINITY_DN3593_c0_g1_i1:320-1042(-)